MQAFLDKAKDFIKGITWENSKRYVGAAVLFVVLVVILVKCTGPDNGSKSTTETTEATEIANKTSADDFEFDTEFDNNTNEEIIALLQKYYTAFVSADTASLETIAYPMTENEKNYIGVLAKYYEEIQNINYFSKKGLTDDSFFISVSNDIKFKGIDTVAPALDFFYVQTDKDGKLYIDNAYSYFNQNFEESPVDKDISEIMDKYMKQQDFIAIQTDIDTKYEEAIKNDDKLATMISTTLEASIREWLANATFVSADEAVAAEQSTESATEQPAESTTEKTTEEKKDEKKDEAKDENKDEAKDEKKDEAKDEAKDEKKDETKKEVTQVKTKDVVNVRDSASKDGKILGKLTEGVVLKKLGEEGEWTIVSYSAGKDGKGYIKTELLKEVK